MQSQDNSVLHFHTSIRYGGGPAGYLFELQRALAKSECGNKSSIEIREIPWPNHELPALTLVQRIARRIQKAQLTGWAKPSQILARVYQTMDFDIRCSRAFAAAAFPALAKHRLVVVHDLFLAAGLAKVDPVWARDKLYVMLHSPDFMVRQALGDVTDIIDAPDNSCLANYFIDWEEYVMNSVRGLIWPCPEAMEGYALTSRRGFMKTRHEYCMTGLARPEINRDIQDLRAEWGIGPGQKAILFLGRPHPHKGFPIFEKLAALAQTQGRKDLVFLWGGRERPDKTPTVSRHLGYVSDNGVAMCAADLNIIPNTVTYMDLGVLQALSVGAPILLSNRGGNRAIASRISELPVFEPLADAGTIKIVDTAIEKFQTSAELRCQMMSAWKRHYSAEVFLQNHIELAQRLTS